MTGRPAVVPAGQSETHDWFALVHGEELRQGDILEGCRTPIPPPSWSTSDQEPDATATIEVVEYDLVVMSQSCDLAHGKLEWLLACPVWSLDEFSQVNERFKATREREQMRRGNIPGFHLLNACSLRGFERPLRVVDFRNFVPLRFADAARVAAKAPARLRLCSPFRERLSQEFARMYMRVGLPSDIPPFQ